MLNLNMGKLLVAVCLRYLKNRLSHNFKPQHVASFCIVLVTWPFNLFVFYQRKNSHDMYFTSWGKIDSIISTWVTWNFWSVKRSRTWCFNIFRSRIRSLKAWSRTGVGVWKMWFRLSLAWRRGIKTKWLLSETAFTSLKLPHIKICC